MTGQGKTTVAIIDQLRTVAKYRVHSKIETASPARIQAILTALAQILEMT
jgi:mRNA-degrading endonuclease toxin of MazEF toxin-antitoxin module